MEGKVVAICTSKHKGEQKHECERCLLSPEHGLEGDAHAGPWHRQVSLLSENSIERMRERGLSLTPGAFGENLVVQGIEVKDLPVGTRLRVGDDIILEITQIGKECHDRCAIYYQAGDCIMPREGVFARVITGGSVTAGVPITILEHDEQ